ncbi:MAG TPA: hypothetical protein VL689_18415 [Paraburkholderia sp.]|jgi:hypothetical protein|nr:hypothetical protein [Paraburkholderia sp.]
MAGAVKNAGVTAVCMTAASSGAIETVLEAERETELGDVEAAEFDDVPSSPPPQARTRSGVSAIAAHRRRASRALPGWVACIVIFLLVGAEQE